MQMRLIIVDVLLYDIGCQKCLNTTKDRLKPVLAQPVLFEIDLQVRLAIRVKGHLRKKVRPEYEIG